MDDEKQNDLLRHIRTQIDLQKREIYLYYAELKLKLPTYIKTLTLGELREKGAIIDPDVSIPKDVEEHFRTNADSTRKRLNLLDKLKEVREKHKSSIKLYYDEVKKQLPDELRGKKMGDINEDDWLNLGIEITRFREITKSSVRGKR